MTQLVLVLLAAGLLAAAGLLQRPLDELREQYDLVPPGDIVAESHPQLALLTTVFGGLRAPIVSYLWIRAEQQKQAGRFFDAMQTADLICQLMPRFPGVWYFHAWNMAWNISVETHTPEERWRWVNNGVTLLRDRGIPLNPKAIILYKELAWIYFDKMGGYMDEMHWEYKKRWAREMQALLGAPPLGTTREVIDAFRPVADERFLDRNPRRQGRYEIQPDKFQQLISSQPLRGYLEELKKRFAGNDEALKAQPLIEFANTHLLEIYSRYSTDDAAAVARFSLPPLATDRDRSLWEWINSPDLAEFRQELLNFVRAQRLWNVYRMDPKWMLRLMEQYKVPLDWRLARAHGLYWASYGVHVCQNADVADIDSINTDRILLFCLRDMAQHGRLVFRPNPDDPATVEMAFLADYRFIEPSHREYIRSGELERQARGKEFQENVFRDGHINWLVDCIEMLYAGMRMQKARELLDWIVENYKPQGEDWKLKDDLDAFVRRQILNDLKEKTLSLEDAAGQMTAAIQAAFESIVRGRAEDYRRSIEYARFMHEVYMKGAPPRLRIPPLDMYLADILASMLLRPETRGAELDFADRVKLYNNIASQEGGNELLLLIYDGVAPALKMLCASNGADFARAFPPPRGLEQQRRRLKKLTAPQR